MSNDFFGSDWGIWGILVVWGAGWCRIESCGKGVRRSQETGANLLPAKALRRKEKKKGLNSIEGTTGGITWRLRALAGEKED